jgi:hypothetical protein
VGLPGSVSIGSLPVAASARDDAAPAFTFDLGIVRGSKNATAAAVACPGGCFWGTAGFIQKRQWKGSEMESNLQVRAADGGYILTYPSGGEKVVHSLEEVMEWLLLHFEGRASTFTGDMFGQVTIERGSERIQAEIKADIERYFQKQA